MANGPRLKSMHNRRNVYYPQYLNTKLFDVQYIRNMIAVCRYTKPDVLFSDVVKREYISKMEKNLQIRL